MYLAQVLGSVVCERKVDGLQGARLLLIQPLDHHQQPSGPVEVAVDTVSASPKSLVYCVGSREAALALDPSFVPVDAAIVGLVDQVNS